MKKLVLNIITPAILLFWMIGCGGGGLSPMPPTEGKVEGVVKNYATGEKVANVTIQLEDINVTSDTNGSFALDGTPLSGRMMVSLSKNGFVKTYKVVNLTPKFAKTSLNVNLVPIGYTGTFDPTNNFNKYLGDGYFSLVAGSLVTLSGDAPNGNVSYEITYLTPATMGIDTFPEEMKFENNESMATYGAMVISFKDAEGNKLQLAQGAEIDVRVPVATAGSTALPATIQLYYYDNALGKWFEDAEGTLSTGQNYYSATVKHIGTIGSGYSFETVNVSGCVQNLYGIRVKDATIHMEGVTYNSMASAYTNMNGLFTIGVKKADVSLITASRIHEVSNTLKIDKPQGDVNLSDCILLGDIPLIVQLSWGVKPYDLDTHVIGPNNYHIWYQHFGNLFDEEHAKLDVDDVTSFGPEVFTALSFPEAGIYHYAVYNYSGTHVPNITNSPARVEAIVNGETTVFTPPPGESDNDRWWNVFDIIVEGSGKIHIQPVNTWSSENNGPASGGTSRTAKIIMPSKN